MTRSLVANLWFVVGGVLLLGHQYEVDSAGPRRPDKVSVFGHGRIDQPLFWAAVAVAFGTGGVCLLPGRRSRPSPAEPVGPTPTRQVFAGLGLFALVPLGLLAVGLGLPAWQRLQASGRPPGLVGYVFLVGAGCLYVALLVKLFRVLIGRPAGAVGWTPWQRRVVAGVVPTGLLVAAVVVGLGLAGSAPGPARFEQIINEPASVAALWGLAAAAVAAGYLAYRLNRWAYPSGGPAVVPAAAEVTPARTCPRCGQVVAAGSPAGLCPRCLLGGLIPPVTAPGATIGFVEAYVAPPAEDVQKLFPHLTVERLLGQGGMGAVYLARQPALDRPVALKLIRPRADDPTFAERFAREARALARMNHPNVVTVYESGEAGGLPYLLMEYVPGPTLRDAMRDKALTPTAALAIIPQICDALQYAHRQGVVHRDIKPENILLTGVKGQESGVSKTAATDPPPLRVKIADFGLAKVADPSAMSLTGTRQAMGTPHYMAPEQWEKPGEVDHRADIYALGVVLYELLTGELPLGRFDPPSQRVRLDVRIDEVVLRALAKEPGRRYQHADDVKAALETIRAGGGVVRTPGFYEYTSRRRFLGLPLVHVVRGIDPALGRPRVAVGWVAVGDGAAVGGVAVSGGGSLGLVALSGGFSIGLIGAFAGGLAAGFVALAGGGAAGLLAAFAGGGAMANGVAVAGGGALAGKFALAGGGAVGRWVWSGSRQDKDFWTELGEWVRFWEADWTDW